ncbi:Homeobox-leucine zipper protein HAT14, partial [Mucuna pruriens]
MELGLSLGNASRSLGFMEKPLEGSNQLGLGFNTTLSIGPLITKQIDQHQQQEQIANTTEENHEETISELSLISTCPKHTNNTLVQLDLLPHTPAVPPINPPSNFLAWDPLPENGTAGRSSMELDVNTIVATAGMITAKTEKEMVISPSSNNAAAWFQMDLCIFSTERSVSGEDYDERLRDCSRGSDEDENGGSGSGGTTRKKLRLNKEQSAFLEESFKEHNTLNPKQKLALAKQLHLRPRQVEVWFQNRRARTKLKQTEVDCEYLKRCCDTLREENRRLQKELQELRALKNLSPFCMQLPATTLTMCPSCERVATNSITTTIKTIHQEPIASKAIEFPIGKPKFYDKS